MRTMNTRSAIPDLPEDDDREEPTWLQEERSLFEAYRRRFKAPPPMFVLEPGPAALKAIRNALKTGRPIEDQTPPGCVS